MSMDSRHDPVEFSLIAELTVICFAIISTGNHPNIVSRDLIGVVEKALIIKSAELRKDAIKCGFFLYWP